MSFSVLRRRFFRRSAAFENKIATLFKGYVVFAMKLPLHEAEAFWSRICFSPDFEPVGRYLAYREMIMGRMVKVTRNMCPVARSLVSEDDWEKVLWQFFGAVGPRSLILRESTLELAQYLKKNPHPLLVKHPYLAELIDYEYREIQMQFAPEDEGKTKPGKLRINPAHTLQVYAWPVHFISEEFWQSSELPRGEYALLLWRKPRTLEIGFMEVNPPVAAMIRYLQDRQLGVSQLLNLVAQEFEFDGKEFKRQGREMVESLIAKEVIYDR